MKTNFRRRGVNSSGFRFAVHVRWKGGFLGIFCSIVLLLVGCQKTIEPSGTPVTIRQVASGQALEIISNTEQTSAPQKVRLIGIDAPDLKQQPWGMEAKQQLEELVKSKSVRLEFDVEKQDQYGRSLAYLWVGNQLANEQLVATGYALAIPRSPNVKYQEQLQRAQESARLMGRGIWNPDNPLRQTPTEFRRQNR
jgi:micrococcal nuclease